MTADSKRRSFPEFARLLSKEPGWADEESALQEILGAFLRGQLSDVTCPRGDVGIGEHGVLLTRVAIPGPDPNPAVLPDPMYIPDRLIEMETPLLHKRVPTLLPPQQPFTRDDWREGFRAFGGQGHSVEVIGFEVLAEIPISAFPPEFRQAYIDWLYTTDAGVARWLRNTNRQPPEWTSQTVLPAKKKQESRMGRPSQKSEIEKAYRDFKDAGKIDFGKPKTAIYKEIRALVHRSSGVVEGLGDETMRKVIGPLFNSDKEAKAQSNKL